MKGLVLAFLDLRAQVRLFLAEVRHHDAQRVAHEASLEYQRATAFVLHTRGNLERAGKDAAAAVRDVRRHQQRRAVGLR